MLRVTLYNVQLTSSFRQNDIGSLKLKGKPGQVRSERNKQGTLLCFQPSPVTREWGGGGGGSSNSLTPGSHISLFVAPICLFMHGKY